MARCRRNVTSTKKNTARLPDWSAAGVSLLLDLVQREQLDEVAERLQIRREGGYAGIDVFAFFVYYFASQLSVGLKGFWYRAREHKVKLAAVAGRKSLASSTAMSRALDAVEHRLLRPQVAWLLTEAVGVEPVLRHPAVQHYDALGQGWHVLDYDPTVTVLRQRALPSGDDLPEPRRRAEGFAEPGYPGRKRGDVQILRATLQHAGSGAWLHAMVNPGNGDRREELPAALQVARDFCTRLDHPVERLLFRADGAYGGVPQLSSFLDAGVHFVTRLNRPALLDQPELRRRLVEASWELVPDSGSGPKRSAADIGLVTLRPAARTRQDDGSSYEPVKVRVVVSRFQREGEPTRGKVVAGWQYELFATSLDADPWPAAEVVASYYGRTGQENRFAQEDRELGLDRIYSYEPAGQELATVIGLMVWNARIALGFELETPPWETPEQQARSPQPDPRPVPPETCEAPELEADAEGSADTVEPDVAEPAVEPRLTEAEAKLADQLGGLDWERLLTKREGWSWNAEAGLLRCPEDIGLLLTCVDVHRVAQHRARIIFRSERGACRDCDLLGDCLTTSGGLMVKLTSFTMDRAEVKAICRQLAKVQNLRKEHAITERKRAAEATGDGAAEPEPLVQPLPATTAEPVLACLPSLFLPAAARHVFDDLVHDLATYVTVDLPDDPIPFPALLARAAGDRQHRRLTWTQHRERYALPDGAELDITFAGGERLVALLRGAGHRARAGVSA